MGVTEKAREHDVFIRKKSMVKRQFKANLLIMHFAGARAQALAFTAVAGFSAFGVKLVSNYVARARARAPRRNERKTPSERKTTYIYN